MLGRRRTFLEARLRRDMTPKGILLRWLEYGRIRRRFGSAALREAECNAAMVVLYETNPSLWALGVSREHLAQRVSDTTGLVMPQDDWSCWNHWTDVLRSVRRACSRRQAMPAIQQDLA